MKHILIIVSLCVFGTSVSHAGFDHSHTALGDLLQKHVVWISNGNDSAVNYTGLQKDKMTLETYLKTLSSVSKKEYDTWSKNQQLAFLINAYNGFTLMLIVDHYGKIDSIRDIGGVISNPWKKKFVPLLESRVSLDMIEHEFIREEGVFDEPLIHVALVCAAKSCPPLRNEAFTAEKLEEQLLDNLRRFLTDRNKNRYDIKENTIELSHIFKWYQTDFTKGFRGYDSLERFVEINKASILENMEPPGDIIPGTYNIKFLKYDWSLNEPQ